MRDNKEIKDFYDKNIDEKLNILFIQNKILKSQI